MYCLRNFLLMFFYFHDPGVIIPEHERIGRRISDDIASAQVSTGMTRLCPAYQPGPVHPAAMGERKLAGFIPCPRPRGKVFDTLASMPRQGAYIKKIKRLLKVFHVRPMEMLYSDPFAD